MSNMKNIPRKIYLQIGDECDSEDFNELSEVSWCKDKIYDNDIEFTLQNKVSDEDDLWDAVMHYRKDHPEKVSDISTDTKPEEDLIYRIIENWSNAVHPISEMVGWLKEYASINERKDINEEEIINSVYKRHKIDLKNPQFDIATVNEMIYDSLRMVNERKDNEEFLLSTQNYPKEYFNLFESKYKRAKKRFDESQPKNNNVGVNDAVEFAEWIGKRMSKDSWFRYGAKFGKWYVHMKGHLTTEELYKEFQESQLQQKESEKELEERTEGNMNLISAFVEHLESENIVIPESVILSFFNA